MYFWTYLEDPVENTREVSACARQVSLESIAEFSTQIPLRHLAELRRVDEADASLADSKISGRYAVGSVSVFDGISAGGKLNELGKDDKRAKRYSEAPKLKEAQGRTRKRGGWVHP